MNELIEVAKVVGGGGVGAGFVVGVMWAMSKRNGKSVMPCPAEKVLVENKECVEKSVAEMAASVKGLVEAVSRNTAQSERVNDTLIKVLTEGRR
jgi:hypothetical protein